MAYNPNEDYAPDMSFNDWIKHINRQLAVTKKKVANHKEDRIPLSEMNTSSALRWDTKSEMSKPLNRHERFKTR